MKKLPHASKIRKQMAVNDLLFWLRKKYSKEITELAIQHELNLDQMGKDEAERLLSEKVKFTLEYKWKNYHSTTPAARTRNA